MDRVKLVLSYRLPLIPRFIKNRFCSWLFRRMWYLAKDWPALERTIPDRGARLDATFNLLSLLATCLDAHISYSPLSEVNEDFIREKTAASTPDGVAVENPRCVNV